MQTKTPADDEQVADRMKRLDIGFDGVLLYNRLGYKVSNENSEFRIDYALVFRDISQRGITFN